LLRQDNADVRLTPLAFKLGLVSEEDMRRVERKVSATAELVAFMRKEGVSPSNANPILEDKESALLNQQVKLSSIITRPRITMEDIQLMSASVKSKCIELSEQHVEVVEQTEISLKYEGYIEREQEMADKMKRLENLKIPVDCDFQSMVSLSLEAREKLLAIQPATIGQASRVSGVSPSDIAVLLIHLNK
jgi:tRNA uridine 5-carboxymethylaminomethyl modification enzyme